jgi:hypothetical protein
MADEHLKSFAERIGSPSRREDSAEFTTLPSHGSKYQAHARVPTEAVYTLHCLRGPAGCQSFQYVHLDSGSSFTVERTGQLISLRFSGLKTIAVAIRGRNLRNLYDYIHQHRMPWIAQLDGGRDFSADDDPVITSIDIAEVGDEGEEFPGRRSATVLEMS